MAKVFGKIIEEEVTFLIDPEVEFVSLVKYAANRMPFKIIKQEDKMDGMLYRVLVPKDIGDEKLKELAEKYSFSTEKEEKGDFKQFRIFTQKEIEKDDNVETVLVALDKENKIYAVVKAEEDAQKSAENLDSVLEAMWAMEQIVYGTLSQPTAKQSERIDTIKKAIENFLDYAMSVLQNTKAEDVVKTEKKEDKKEDIAEIVAKTVNEIVQKQKQAEKDIEAFKSEAQKTLEKLVTNKLEELQKSIKEESEAFITKETYEKSIKELKESIESISGVIKKQSEVDENGKSKKTEDEPEKGVTEGFKFFTAI